MNARARLLPAAELLRAHGYDDVAAELERRAREPVKLSREEAGAMREVLIRALAEHFSGSTNATADAIVLAASRYAANWHRWEELNEPPEHHRGKPEALFFELHRLAEQGGHWPCCKRIIFASLQFSTVEVANFRPHTDDQKKESA